MDAYKNFVITAARVLHDANVARAISAVIVINFEGLPELDGMLGYDEVDETLAKLVSMANRIEPVLAIKIEPLFQGYDA